MAGFEVQGCRQLLLLHDQQGHPLLATTHRSDLHLTAGVPALVRAYERASTLPRLTRLVMGSDNHWNEESGSLLGAVPRVPARTVHAVVVCRRMWQPVEKSLGQRRKCCGERNYSAAPTCGRLWL